MSTHIETMREWWNGSERGPFFAGDTLIQNHPTDPDEYTVYTAEEANPDSGEYVRILERAPEKPAWHDAVAVIAETDTHRRQVFERDGDAYWFSTDGDGVEAEALYNVTPLIEQRVTKEMARRVQDFINNTWDDVYGDVEAGWIAAAALGLDPA